MSSKQQQSPMKPQPMPEDEEPRKWRPESLTLVTEIRTCRCGEIYRVPNNKLLVEYESKAPFSRRQYKPSSDDISHLFHRKIEVHSETQACEKCFRVDKEGERRPPRNVPRNLRRSLNLQQKKMKKPAPRPLRLEDL